MFKFLRRRRPCAVCSGVVKYSRLSDRLCEPHASIASAEFAKQRAAADLLARRLDRLAAKAVRR